MKITVECNSINENDLEYSRKFTLEPSNDLDINEMMEEIKICLYAMTYHPDLIRKYFEGDD